MDVFYHHFRWLKKLGCNYEEHTAGVEFSYKFANKHAKIFVLIAGSGMPWIELGRADDFSGKSLDALIRKVCPKRKLPKKLVPVWGMPAYDEIFRHYSEVVKKHFVRVFKGDFRLTDRKNRAMRNRIKPVETQTAKRRPSKVAKARVSTSSPVRENPSRTASPARRRRS